MKPNQTGKLGQTNSLPRTFFHVASLAFAPSSQEDVEYVKILTCYIFSKLAYISMHCALYHTTIMLLVPTLTI